MPPSARMAPPPPNALRVAALEVNMLEEMLTRVVLVVAADMYRAPPSPALQPLGL